MTGDLTHTPRTATDIAAQVRSGRVSAADVIGSSLDRIAAYNGTVNAFVEVRAREAMRAAAAVDTRRAEGINPGPLAGVPIAVKDSMWEAGRVTTAGSRALLGFRPPHTVVAVKRLVAAGAIIVGRTNLPEFCYRGNCDNELYGTTVNPADVSRTPGGSSGGAAAAVAAAMVPIALGSDGGGSIRIPASFCGVVGFKPTFGHVPRAPGFPGWFTLNHVGPITATVADAALAYRVMAGPDPRDSTSVPVAHRDPLHQHGALSGLRVAYSRDLGYAAVDHQVLQAFDTALDKLAAAGVELVQAHPALNNPIDVWNTLAMTDNVASEGPHVRGGDAGADAMLLIHAGEAITGAQYAAARNAQSEFATAWGVFMEDVDLVVTPTMECTAFPARDQKPASIAGKVIDGVDDDWCHFCYPFNLTGQPAISIPMSPVGPLPMGLQIVGRRGRDDLVLHAAHQWEHLVNDPQPPHPLTPSTPTLTPEDLQTLNHAVDHHLDHITVAPDTHVAAGQHLHTPTATITITRTYTPHDTTRTIELDTQ
jgi:Asp-tRNA(Asn)/Glu-tRNA(Gln) amidotransferase A subunit family amidase